MKRNKKLGKAISPVLSTVILTSVMLIVALTIMGFANNVFSIQSDTTEFDQAKNIVVNFARIVDDVASKQGSSGYVRFNTRSGGPYFLSPAGSITVGYSTGTTYSYLLYNSRTNLFKYKAGSYASAPGRVVLSGNADKTIIMNNEAPLGVVYTEQKDGAWVVMNFTRIGVLDLGTFNFSKGMDAQGRSKGFRLVNLIQVSYVNVTSGEWRGSGSINAVATCKNITTTYHWASCPLQNPTDNNYNYPISFKVILDGVETTSDVLVKGADKNYTENGKLVGIDTMIMFINSNVEIDIVG
jgi:hypothetical protein